MSQIRWEGDYASASLVTVYGASMKQKRGKVKGSGASWTVLEENRIG